jgi:hypothetical protein
VKSLAIWVWRRTRSARSSVTVVFDRGGWSPKLFKRLIADGFDILTYRKKPIRTVPGGSFVRCCGRLDGRSIEYELDDRNVRLMKGHLRLRQVTRRSPAGGHQTTLVTSRKDLPALQVAYRMFERWRQENFFKYMREEYLIDALVDYAVEPADPNRLVPNLESQDPDGTETLTLAPGEAGMERSEALLHVRADRTRLPKRRHGVLKPPLRLVERGQPNP